MPSVRVTQFCLLLIFFGGWELTTRLGIVDVFFFPMPSNIFLRLISWFSSPTIYKDILLTLFEASAGFALGTGLGVICGIVLALNPYSSKVFEPFLKILNAIPRIVLAPIFTLWFGLGLMSKVVFVITLVFFIAFFNTYQGVREVNPVVLSNARLLRASKTQLLIHVYLPSAASWILSSLRTSLGWAISGAVVGEYLGSTGGIGHVIARAEGVFDAAGVFAGIVVLALFVVIMDWLITRVEKRYLVWQPTKD